MNKIQETQLAEWQSSAEERNHWSSTALFHHSFHDLAKKIIPVVSPLLPSHSLTKHREVPYDYFGSAGVDPDTQSLSGTVNFEFSSNIQVRGIQNFLPALVFKHVPSKWCESSHQCLKPTGTCHNWEKNNSFLFFLIREIKKEVGAIENCALPINGWKLSNSWQKEDRTEWVFSLAK